MLKADLIDLDELLEYPENPKLHDIPAIAGSISDYGFLQRCTVNIETGLLLSGHGRRMALQTLRSAGKPAPDNIVVDGGRWLVPVDFVEIPAEQEDEVVVILNQLTITGGWDTKKLVGILQKVQASGRLPATGFTKAELKRMARRAFPPDINDPGAALKIALELRERYQVDAGQVWRLVDPNSGLEHFILCGDSQDQEAIKRLTADYSIEAIITDPPFELASDKIRAIFDPLAPRAAVMMGIGWRPYDLPRDGWVSRLDLVWERTAPQSFPVPAMPIVYHNNILFMTKGFKTRLGWLRPDAGFGSVIRLQESDQREWRYGLGYAKPVAIFVEMLKGFEWERWFDPFLGSGASLLACNLLGMECRGIERDSATLAVAIHRAVESGLTAERVD